MKVTPLDLRQQRFKTVMRGYDRGEVQAFMLEVADDYENALRENDRLRQDVVKLEAVLGEHRGQERNLRNTLLPEIEWSDLHNKFPVHRNSLKTLAGLVQAG